MYQYGSSLLLGLEVAVQLNTNALDPSMFYYLQCISPSYIHDIAISLDLDPEPSLLPARLDSALVISSLLRHFLGA